MASPRWRLCGFGSGLESNEKRFEMSQSASERSWVGPLGLVSVISPWLCLTRGGLEPFVGRPLNLGLLWLISNEATAIS